MSFVSTPTNGTTGLLRTNDLGSDWKESEGGNCHPKVSSNFRFMIRHPLRVTIYRTKKDLFGAWNYFYPDQPPSEKEKKECDFRGFWVCYREENPETGAREEVFAIHVRGIKSHQGGYDDFYGTLGHELAHLLELMEEDPNSTFVEVPLYGDEG